MPAHIFNYTSWTSGGLFSAQKHYLWFFLEDNSLLTSIPKKSAKIEPVSAMIRSLWKKNCPSPKPTYQVGTEKWVLEVHATGAYGAMFVWGFEAFKQVLRWHAAWKAVDFEPTGRCFYPTSCKQGATLSTVWAMLQPAAMKTDIIPQNWNER